MDSFNRRYNEDFQDDVYSNNDNFSTTDRYSSNINRAQIPQNQLRQYPNNPTHLRRSNDLFERTGIPVISSEDIQIIRECNKESLYYHCLPITAALCSGLIYAARVKQIQPRFYHFLGAALFSYFASKFTYRSKCEEKLINSRSNSPFVNAIRKRRGMFIEGKEYGNALESSMESDWITPESSMDKSYGIQEFDNETSPRKRKLGPFVDEFSSSNELQNEDIQHNPDITYEDLRMRNRSFKNI